MSMPGWLNDAHPLPNGDNGHGAFDPMSFVQPPSAFDYSRSQQQDLPGHLQNGNVPNGSPAFQNPQYQTQSSIPSKRPRPREDSVVASPHQVPGGVPTTRSHTPQQGLYGGLQGPLNGAHQFQGSNVYQRPNVSSAASQSPVMQNQMFNQQQGPQRVQTVSPALFSPPPQGFGQQGSPVSSEHGSRNHTPQNGGQTYMQGMQYGGNHNQPFTPPTANNHMTPTPGQYGQGPPNAQHQQHINEIRQQQLMRQMQVNNAARQQGGQFNPGMTPQNQMANFQMQARAQQIQQQQAMMMMKASGGADNLVRTVATFMQQRGLQFNPHPTVAGRPISLLQLFSIVFKMGGSNKVTSTSQWPMVAQHLQIPPPQYMLASQELHTYWQNNLAGYETYYVQQQQHQQRQRMATEQMRLAAQNGDPAAAQNPWSPMKQAVEQSPDAQGQRQMAGQGPIAHMLGQNQDIRHAQQNGYPTPQQANQGRQPNVHGASQQRPGIPAQAIPTPQRRQTSQAPGAPKVKEENSTKSKAGSGEVAKNSREAPRQMPMEPNFKAKHHPHPIYIDAQTHGGLQGFWSSNTLDRPGSPEPDDKKFFGKIMINDLTTARPWAPHITELAPIDIRALILSLRSGLHAEVRVALDTLATVSFVIRDLLLDKCEDLLDALIEYAEEQLDVLAENAPEVSEDILINSYEDTVRGCLIENQTVQDVAEYGTLEYDLERSVDKLICVTTILRNFSDSPVPGVQKQLAEPILVRFLTTAIRLLGTRNMLLRSHLNTLDFSKDVLILLSNLSQEIDFPSKEEASCILHFLLSFSPLPSPTTVEGHDVVFSPYEPSVHRYYSYAVETLAKLLARDDPNRSFYRSIFLADCGSSPTHEVLTRTFGLATAGIPRCDNPNFVNLVQHRVPVMAMGLVAAEIITSLMPSSEHKLARAWLESQDGVASSLMEVCFMYRLLRLLPPQRTENGMTGPDPYGIGMIRQRGATLLVKLAERAKDPQTSLAWLPPSIMPKKRELAKVLYDDRFMEPGLLRQICIYAGMEP